ncbi:hypothetical protein AB1L07_02180 [Niallia alba]|uniref:hypothetical protein n=1 Tax=Niallia alba TaxID=2729105 RepID=UPI0039A1FC77
MGLLDNKNWMAQDLYNEYLELKADIAERVKVLEYQKNISGTITEKGIKELEDKNSEKAARLRKVLNELKVVHGIAMEDLILLSIGIDI